MPLNLTFKKLTLISSLLLIVSLGLPGLMGFLAKNYIDRAIELTNLNTSLTVHIEDFQQHWFSSQLTLTVMTEDPYEDELIPLGTFKLQLKHGPITLVNNRPGFGAFYLFNEGFSFQPTEPPQTIVGYARAGFTGTIQLNINIGIDHQINAQSAHNRIAQENQYTPLILSIEADSEFNTITYRMLWPGIKDPHSHILNIRLSGALHRMDDEHWQGFSRVQAKEISLPGSALNLQELDLTIRNNVRITESNRATQIYIEGQANKIQTLWNNWDTPKIKAEIEQADISALRDLYDLAERIYLESDSAFDEYAQMEYMTSLQTLIPSLLSDHASLILNTLSFTQPDKPKNRKQISGHMTFPDLPDYMDDHLLSLIAKTSGHFTIETLRTDNKKVIESEIISIKKGRLSRNNQPFDPSFLN
jgi:hypothetical protein